jgi:hypothetical protein
MADYIDLNKASWDERAPAHAASPDYAFEQFVTDPQFLSEVVRFDLRCRDVRPPGRTCCHIGTDTISLSGSVRR